MANHLKVANVLSIKALHAQGWSQRRIARELGISREAVARHLSLASKQAKAPTGSAHSKQATSEKAPTGSGSAETISKPSILEKAPTGSRSLCEPYREVISGWVDQGLSAQRIYQDLVSEYGFAGKYPSVRRFVGRLKQASPLPFRRIEVCPGEEAQIDFGKGAPIVGPDGRRRRTHVLRVVLSHSRKAYSESVYRQTTDNLIAVLENAFWHFGGVPRTLVPDNLKAAVIKADWYDPDLNPKLQSFCEHYRTVLPSQPSKSLSTLYLRFARRWSDNWGPLHNVALRCAVIPRNGQSCPNCCQVVFETLGELPYAGRHIVLGCSLKPTV